MTIGNLNMALGFVAIVATAHVGWIMYLGFEALEWLLLRHRSPRAEVSGMTWIVTDGLVRRDPRNTPLQRPC